MLTSQMLCGWYVYLAVLALLAALSSGPRSRSRYMAMVAVVASLLLVVSLLGLLSLSAELILGLKLIVLASGALILLFNRREDTRLIALLLAGAALIPVGLHFWRP